MTLIKNIKQIGNDPREAFICTKCHCMVGSVHPCKLDGITYHANVRA
jgi:hypothetical protein